jgi:deoxyribodipyrimidine photo-lyase
MWRARRPDATDKRPILTETPKEDAPVLVWFRRDLRLADNPALHAAAASGRAIIPVFVLDETDGVRFPGGAGLWWLDKSLNALGAALADKGSRLVLRRGAAGAVVSKLVEETGAHAVYWNRLYEPGQRDRDANLKASLKADGVRVESFNAALLLEPWEIETKTGGVYQVFTPFWRAARQTIGDFTLHQAPKSLSAPIRWPRSDTLASWRLHPTQPDWSKGFESWKPGEAGARHRLSDFVEDKLGDYPEHRDQPGTEGTSRLSPHLHWGEIGPRQVWRAIEAGAHPHRQDAQAEKFLAELGWREFNHHLLFQRPDLPACSFKPDFDDFPWRKDKRAFTAWSKGLTGYPMVDAGMRELWTTGYMENRVRMIAASFLIKHLLIDWREGEAWFWDTLLDADLANNVMNWQWVAGSGADASPFFRIFNPIAQGEKFDPEGAYVRRWIPELGKFPAKYVHAPWTAPAEVLEKAGVKLGADYPKPIVDHDEARLRALAALRSMRKTSDDD